MTLLYCPHCSKTLQRTSELYFGCLDRCCRLVQVPTEKAGQELRAWEKRLRDIFGGRAPYRLGETYGQWLGRLRRSPAPKVPATTVIELGDNTGQFPPGSLPVYLDTPANEAIDWCNEQEINLCSCDSQFHFQKGDTEMTGKEACEKLSAKFQEFKINARIEFEKCGSCGKAEPTLTCEVVIPNAKPVAGRSYKDDMKFEAETIEDVVMAALLWNSSPHKGGDVEEIVEATK